MKRFSLKRVSVVVVMALVVLGACAVPALASWGSYSGVCSMSGWYVGQTTYTHAQYGSISTQVSHVPADGLQMRLCKADTHVDFSGTSFFMAPTSQYSSLADNVLAGTQFHLHVALIYGPDYRDSTYRDFSGYMYW